MLGLHCLPFAMTPEPPAHMLKASPISSCVQASAQRHRHFALAMQRAHVQLMQWEAGVLTARDLRSLAAASLPQVPPAAMDAVLGAIPADAPSTAARTAAVRKERRVAAAPPPPCGAAVAALQLLCEDASAAGLQTAAPPSGLMYSTALSAVLPRPTPRDCLTAAAAAAADLSLLGEPCVPRVAIRVGDAADPQNADAVAAPPGLIAPAPEGQPAPMASTREYAKDTLDPNDGRVVGLDCGGVAAEGDAIAGTGAVLGDLPQTDSVAVQPPEVRVLVGESRHNAMAPSLNNLAAKLLWCTTPVQNHSPAVALSCWC